ncbi:accelerated cell death 11 [Cinnamomum micranthum f. kanehirae]|uniref:Accelerated cell death 11 n=1 Tax=Cinnamomum micranthum f. kanehirae TaxID=337451 RepID=A0A3S3NE33_9MAGN|nr:accelerated cell death 11 [Cinnamomum micranthum f. kanehirae]
MWLQKRIQSPRQFQYCWKSRKKKKGGTYPTRSKEERGRGIGDRASHRKKKLPRFSLMADGEKPLRKIAASFKDLAAAVNSQNPEVKVEVAPFSAACSHVSVLFGCLGIAFKFAEMDYVAKVDDLTKAANSIGTLKSLLDHDIEQGTVRKAGSHSRNLLRVKRGLDMVRVLFEQILASEESSLKSPASVAYAQVFAPHHGWAIRKAVAAGMYALPTRAQLLKKLNEDAESARIQMQSYISASALVIQYIDKLFLSKELGIDW